jgi:glutamate:GABA antiporter
MIRQTGQAMNQPWGEVAAPAASSLPPYPASTSTGFADQTKDKLPSEALVRGAFPAILHVNDLAVLAIVLILYISNTSLLTLAGAAAIPYWLIGFLTFLIPSAVITNKLAHMFPEQGAFYVWVFKALGPFWDSLLGFFCWWWPPVLLIMGAGTIVSAFVSGLGASFGQLWLADPWQQGVVVMMVLALTWVIASLPLRIAQWLIRNTLYCYLGVIALMGIATAFWLLSGHPSQTDFSAKQFQVGPANFTFYGSVILACLGIQLPLNMTREVRNQQESLIPRYLPRAIIVIVIGYLVAWLALAVILPQDPTNPLNAGFQGNIGLIYYAAFGNSIGHLISVVSTLILVTFYIVSSGAYCLVQSRLVVMSALDRRLPAKLGKLNRNGVPLLANTVQISILAVLAVIVFFIIPIASKQGSNFQILVYALIPASASVLWAISALALFVIGGVLVVRYQWLAQQVDGGSISLILACSIIGSLATLAACYLVFTGPWTPLMTQGNWFFWVALIVLASLAVGAVHAFLAAEPDDIWYLIQRVNKHPELSQ